jgi:dolichyl-phosphate beta-glucosyltransferase
MSKIVQQICLKIVAARQAVLDVEKRLSVFGCKMTQEKRRSLSVIIPAYNEEARLVSTVRDAHAFLIAQDYDAEILVVNDGSRDGTLGVATALERSLALLRVLTYPTNRGKGYAVRTGVLAARRSAILFSDADQSTPIDQIEQLWPWYDQGHDIVMCSRHLFESKHLVQQSIHRQLMGKAFHAVISLVGAGGFCDTQCGFKLFRAKVAKRIFKDLHTMGFAFDVEILIRAREMGYRIAEVPVIWKDKPGSHIRPVLDTVRMLEEVLTMRRGQ